MPTRHFYCITKQTHTTNADTTTTNNNTLTILTPTKQRTTERGFNHENTKDPIHSSAATIIIISHVTAFHHVVGTGRLVSVGSNVRRSSSSSLNMAPKFDKATQKWFPSNPEVTSVFFAKRECLYITLCLFGTIKFVLYSRSNILILNTHVV